MLKIDSAAATKFEVIQSMNLIPAITSIWVDIAKPPTTRLARVVGVERNADPNVRRANIERAVTSARGGRPGWRILPPCVAI